MDSTEACLLKYRHALRQMLYIRGELSNPGVTDDWILDQISTIVNGEPIKWVNCSHCGGNFPSHTSLNLHISVEHPEFANTGWYNK